MQESKIINLKATESSILAWIQLFYTNTKKVSSFEDLLDGTIFLGILSDLPKFKLTQQITLNDEQKDKIYYRMKNMRILYDSLKLFYQTKLLKNTSKFSISLSQLCTGKNKEVVKFVEFLIGAIIWSEGKKYFLDNILCLQQQHQETFMGIIKNAMNISEDYDENFTSPSKARNLLERIQQLQQQNICLNQNLEDLKSQLLIKEQNTQCFSRQLNSVRKQNSDLLEQIDKLKSPQKSSCDNTPRFELSILQQKLNIQRNSYQIRIKQLQHLLLQANEKQLQAREYQTTIVQLTQKNQVLNYNNEHIQNQLDKGLAILKEKDELVIKLRTKIQQHQSRILKLEGQLEQANLKYHEPSFINIKQNIQNPSLNNFRCASNLREEINSVVQELTLQNSRLINEKVQKQQQYQEIILNQREEIRIIKQQNDQYSKAQRKQMKENKESNNNIFGEQIIKITLQHQQQVNKYIEIMENQRKQIEELRDKIRKQKENKEERNAKLLKQANLINPIRI